MSDFNSPHGSRDRTPCAYKCLKTADVCKVIEGSKLRHGTSYPIDRPSRTHAFSRKSVICSPVTSYTKSRSRNLFLYWSVRWGSVGRGEWNAGDRGLNFLPLVPFYCGYRPLIIGSRLFPLFRLLRFLPPWKSRFPPSFPCRTLLQPLF